MIIARCWSGRFPGKVIADLYGRPVIEWIIEKAKRITPDVVIAGSDDPRDLPLVHIARRMGVSCTRGPANDLLARMERAADMLGLTHWLEFLGDSPFVVEGVAERVMDMIYQHPEGPDYGAGPFPAGLTGVNVGGTTREKLRKARALMDRQDVQAHIAKGWDWWNISTIIPGCWGGETQTANVAHLFDQPASGFSLCIDYPLQLAFWNRVCERLGKFPTYNEIIRAHLDWSTL